MITVISPAKKLDFEQAAPVQDHTTPGFLSQSRNLNKILRGYTARDLMKLMHISANLADLNHERILQWKTPFTPKNAKQSLFAFRGDVYVGLNADTLKAADIKFAQNHLRILSGLYGILRPLDLMQPYRLEMGTRLTTARGKDLYEFWGARLTEKINEELNNHKAKILVNLASNEYFKAIITKQVEGEIVTPVFKEKKGDKYSVIAIHAKKARGLMSRFIIEQRIDKPEAIKDFNLGGYRFSSKLSNDKQWVFSRG